VAPGQDEGLRRGAANLARGLENSVVLERVHAGDPDDRGPRPPDPGGDAVIEAQVHDRGLVARAAQRRGDVFEPERLDTEEGTQAEALVSRIGSQEQDSHRRRL
jgi:hypothetical protein